MSSISISKTIAVSLLLIMLATAALSQLKCYYGVGQYRNCTCGIQYRILEKRCCSSEECQQPVLTTENFTCPFVCQNGGTYDAERKLCHCPASHHGLCCEQETPLCGEVFLTHKGDIFSLNYPNNYPNNANCIWKVSTDPERRIVIGAEYFSVEPGSNIFSCNYDYLQLWDGTSESKQSLGIFCGGGKSYHKIFQTLYSTGSNLFIQFRSDFIVSKKGFHLKYSVFYAGQECGPYSIYTLPRGTITSPHYPIRYRPNENCQWTIQVMPKHDIYLTFQNIDIISAGNCRYGDYLLVTGKTSDKKVKHLAAFCGKVPPRPFKIPADSKGLEEITLIFRTDQKYEGRGFVLNYRQILSNGSSGDESGIMAEDN